MKRTAANTSLALDGLLNQPGVVQIATAGMLPSFVFEELTLQQLRSHIVTVEGRGAETAGLCWDTLLSFAARCATHNGARRELIEMASVRDLVSGGLVHRSAWRFRIGARQAADVLDRLREYALRNDRYESALCRDWLPFSFVIAGDWACVDEHAPPARSTDARGFRSRSDDLVAALRAEFQRMWNLPQTIRERKAIAAHLRQQRDRIFQRVIL